jgi:hypothetical protein
MKPFNLVNQLVIEEEYDEPTPQGTGFSFLEKSTVPKQQPPNFIAKARSSYPQAKNVTLKRSNSETAFDVHKRIVQDNKATKLF